MQDARMKLRLINCDLFWSSTGHKGRNAKIFGWAKSMAHAIYYVIFDTRQCK